MVRDLSDPHRSDEIQRGRHVNTRGADSAQVYDCKHPQSGAFPS